MRHIKILPEQQNLIQPGHAEALIAVFYDPKVISAELVCFCFAEPYYAQSTGSRPWIQIDRFL
jgi:hypothetical protein